MTGDSPFGGRSGKTLWRFFAPSTLLTLLPATVALLVLVTVSIWLNFLPAIARADHVASSRQRARVARTFATL